MSPTSEPSKIGHYDWPAWLMAALKLAADAPLFGEPAVLSWRPIKRSAARRPSILEPRFVDPADPLAAYATGHTFHLVVDFREVVSAAFDSGAPPALQSWALRGLSMARDYLADGSAVLRHLLARIEAGEPCNDPREVALRAQHLRHLQANAGDKLVRWARAVNRAVVPIASPSVQFSPAGHHLVLRPAVLMDRRLRRVCRVPVYPTSRRTVVSDDPLSQEASWLLSCDSSRDGARRNGGLILVHPAAYLLVARLLSRPYFGSQHLPLPQLDAPRSAWIDAAHQWIALINTTTQGQWLSRYEGRVRAETLGWSIPPDMPVMALQAEMVESVLGGRAKAFRRLPDIAKKHSTRQGAPLHTTVPYEGQLLRVTQRRNRRTDKLQLYFELPFVPPDLSTPPYSYFTLQGVRLWNLEAILIFAQSRHYEAEAFARFAHEFSASMLGEPFRMEVFRQSAVDRAQRRALDGDVSLGSYTRYELDQLKRVFDQREHGPLSREFWNDLVAEFPGRDVRSLRRAAKRLMVAKVREVGWRTFRLTGWWPGGAMARAIFARIGAVKAPNR